MQSPGGSLPCSSPSLIRAPAASHWIHLRGFINRGCWLIKALDDTSWTRSVGQSIKTQPMISFLPIAGDTVAYSNSDPPMECLTSLSLRRNLPPQLGACDREHLARSRCCTTRCCIVLLYQYYDLFNSYLAQSALWLTWFIPWFASPRACIAWSCYCLAPLVFLVFFQLFFLYYQAYFFPTSRYLYPSFFPQIWPCFKYLCALSLPEFLSMSVLLFSFSSFFTLLPFHFTLQCAIPH